MSQHHDGRFTAFDGTSIVHRSWLPDDDPKAVVLLVHGLGEHSGRYGHVAARLISHGYAVHALDLRGHGKSDGKRAYVRSYDEFMADLIQFRALVTAEHPGLPLFVLGHSMGGNLVMSHVLDHQDGLAGMVLSGPALKPGDDFSPIKLKLLAGLARIAPGVRPEGLSADAISRDPAVVDAYRADPLVFTGKISAGLGGALIAAMNTFPTRYPSLTLPILLMHGTEDRLTNVDGSRQLEAEAVNAEIEAHYYDGLYHEIFNEPEQDAVLGDLVTWLDGHTT
ncbi:MAG: lysophospholipase [Ilumatobacteraceae bacterium]